MVFQKSFPYKNKTAKATKNVWGMIFCTVCKQSEWEDGNKLLERDRLHGNICVWKTSPLAFEWIIYYQTKYFSTLVNTLSFSQTVLSVVWSVSQIVYIHWNEYTCLWTSSVSAVYCSSATLKRLTLRNIQWHIMTHTYTYALTSGCLSVFLIIYINIYKSDLKAYWISKDFPRTTKRTSSRLIWAI